VSVAGLVLVRQRPGSANGVLFITLEDETEIANLIIWPSVFERQRRLILSASMIGCRGKLQREGDVIHVIAEHLTDLSCYAGLESVRKPSRFRMAEETRPRKAEGLTRVRLSGGSLATSTSPTC